MRGKIFWGVAVLLMAAVIVAIQLNKSPISEQRETAGASPGSSSKPQPSNSTADIPTTISQARELGRAPSATGTLVDSKFQQWITDEAKAIDRPNIDGDKKEAEIKEIVRKLTPEQSRQLLQTASSPVAPAGEKILSTYLMVQGGLNSRAELARFIAMPLKENGPHEPHSEAEIKGVREKSLRIMAIDGLVSQAKTDPAARQALAKAIAESDDPYIKGYATEKLKELERE